LDDQEQAVPIGEVLGPGRRLSGPEFQIGQSHGKHPHEDTILLTLSVSSFLVWNVRIWRSTVSSFSLGSHRTTTDVWKRASHLKWSV